MERGEQVGFFIQHQNLGWSMDKEKKANVVSLFSLHGQKGKIIYLSVLVDHESV